MIEQAKIALKSPLTYALLIITGFASYFITAYKDGSEMSNKDCRDMIIIANERIDKLERVLDEYTRAVLFKDIQIKEQAFIIDSLKSK